MNLSDLAHEPTVGACVAKAVSVLGLNVVQAEVLDPALNAYFVAAKRTDVRKAERLAADNFRKGQPLRRALSASGLMSKGFVLSNDPTSFVTWGAATVADHECRIEYLRMKMRGIERTIDLHCKAIDLISRTPGATCLNDCSPDVLASVS